MTAPLVAKAPCDVDVIARELARCAAMAKQMPPAWEAAKVMHGFTAPDGSNLGRVLPGRGIALASDLRSLGITQPIPHVFEKSLAMRAIDAFGGRERLAMSAAAFLLALKCGAHDLIAGLPLLAGAITNYDGIINGRANGKGQDLTAFITSGTTVASQWSSTTRMTPRLPGGTFAPAAIPGGTALNRTHAGSLSLGIDNPTGGDKKYLITIGYTSGSTLNIILLVDLLVAASGIDANTASAQTVNTTALTRYTGTAAAGNLIAFEVTTALGATAANVTATYTNQAGTSGRSSATLAMTTSAIANRLMPAGNGVPFLALADGDTGVRSVESIQFSAAMLAGVCNLLLYRPLHFLPGVGASVYVERDSTVQIDGLTELTVGSDSELGFLTLFVLPNSTTSGNLTTFFRTVAG